MRNNQPITNEEYLIPEGLTLVSKTDLAGNILECNDAFEVASGYSRDQLIGQPHNLIRHPDVPEAVFADFWGSLKNGNTWSQIVKNRRADGGYYWVRANATPIYSEGKVIGYMSVRTTVTQAEKTAAAQAYKDINAGKAKIKDGRIYTGINWKALNFYARLEPQYKLALQVALVFLLPYFIYSILADHGLIEQITVITMGLLLPFIYGLVLKKENCTTEKELLKIASGEALDDKWFDPNTSLGKRQTAIRSVYLANKERSEEAAYQLDQSQQLQTAMDQVSTNIMITDANLCIKYMNIDMVKFLEEKESTLQQFLPDFKVDSLLGQNIDIFHKEPSHQRGLLNKLTEPYLGKIQLGDTYLEVYAIPVYNRAGQRTATVAEWRDKTAEVQLLEQVNSAVQSAQAGILNTRIDLSRVEGVAKDLSGSINDLIATIEQPINEAIKVAISLSEGDLTKHIDGEYLGRFAVLQDSLNVAVESLDSMMAQTKITTHAVSGGAEQIYQGSIDLNNRTQSQAASLEETASSMEEMTAAVKQNAENAREASKVTHTTSKQATDGVEVMHSAIEAMEQINTSSQKINDIIGLIDSIAFQTNLLALNAAVEAARAGEHGRGFAVVAGEVRNLAGKSSEAAKDIRDLIEDTVKKVSEGTVHVKGSGDALNEIVESISNVNQIIEEIAASSNEQSEGVSLVNSSITNIDTAVQQNAALVEETAATAEELGEMSNMMSNNISKFTINESASTLLTNNSGFDFEGARRSHKQWRVKARALVNDIDVNVNTTSASNDSACVLGTWLHGDGQSYSALPSFQQLKSNHCEFHDLIGKIIDFKNIEDMTSANSAVEQLVTLSHTVVDLITQLEKELSGTTEVVMPPPVKKVEVEAQAKTPVKPKPALASTNKENVQKTKQQTPAPAQPSTDNGDEWTDF